MTTSLSNSALKTPAMDVNNYYLQVNDNNFKQPQNNNDIIIPIENNKIDGNILSVNHTVDEGTLSDDDETSTLHQSSLSHQHEHSQDNHKHKRKEKQKKESGMQ